MPKARTSVIAAHDRLMVGLFFRASRQQQTQEKQFFAVVHEADVSQPLDFNDPVDCAMVRCGSWVEAAKSRVSAGKVSWTVRIDRGGPLY
jgi:hypothetical protein